MTILPASESAPEPDSSLMFAADAGGILAVVLDKTPLGVASSALSLSNDQSLQNKIMNGVGLVPAPEVGIPATFITAESDYFNWMLQTWANGAYESLPTQTINNGREMIPNPQLMDESDPANWGGPR
jgi:hypothetical protein